MILLVGLNLLVTIYFYFYFLIPDLFFGVATIVEKMVETRLMWFGHIERKIVDFVVRKVDQLEADVDLKTHKRNY